jgi:hypothetical protein
MPHIPNRTLLSTPPMKSESQWQPLLDYVRARLEIQHKKEAGEPWPWTKDRILQKHKFCCVFRDDDRTSREAREAILSLTDDDEKRCCAATFRLYNYIPTLRRLITSGLSACTDSATIMRCILAETPHYNPLAYKVQPKGRVWNTQDICDTTAQAHRCILEGWEPSPSARQTCLRLHADLGMGGFVGYQAMQDLRWVFGPYTDEDVWCLVGIGAHRGLKRMMGTYKGNTDWKKRNRDRPKIPKDLSVPVEYRGPLLEILVECKKISKRFNMLEVEHNLCESDKLARIRSGEGKSRYYNRKGR